MLVACIFIVILILAAGAAVTSATHLAKGDADKAFRGALKIFVLLSVLTGIFVFCAFYEGGLAAGLKKLIHGNYAFVFWIAFAGQMIALPLLIVAWRKQRH